MGKLSKPVGVIGDFFTEGENISPGNALARVNKATNENDFAIMPVDADGNATNCEDAVAFELGVMTNVSAVVADTSFNETITGTESGGGYSFQVSKNAAAAVDIDTANANRKAATLIDQILKQKPQPDGWAVEDPANITGLCWIQSEQKIVATEANVKPTISEAFACIGASTSGRDWGE